MQIRARKPVNPGKVEWSGDNPGIYLKASNDGDWRHLALFFNIVLSPHGRGKAMLVLSEPDQAGGKSSGNVCITDNMSLTRYLLDDFVQAFPTFRGRAGYDHVDLLEMDSHESAGNPSPGGQCSETLRSGDTSLTMSWQDIQAPFAVEVSPQQSATGRHDMYGFFMEANDGGIAINGKSLPGQVVTRPFFGKTMSSAFLAMSETWVAPPQGDN